MFLLPFDYNTPAPGQVCCFRIDESLRVEVTVEYAAQVKRATGIASETIKLDPDNSIQQLAASIVEKHGDEARRVLLDSGGILQPSILIFVDDEQVRDPSTKLANGQRVTFLSPISGG